MAYDDALVHPFGVGEEQGREGRGRRRAGRDEHGVDEAGHHGAASHAEGVGHGDEHRREYKAKNDAVAEVGEDDADEADGDGEGDVVCNSQRIRERSRSQPIISRNSLNFL